MEFNDYAEFKADFRLKNPGMQAPRLGEAATAAWEDYQKEHKPKKAPAAPGPVEEPRMGSATKTVEKAEAVTKEGVVPVAKPKKKG